MNLQMQHMDVSQNWRPLQVGSCLIPVKSRSAILRTPQQTQKTQRQQLAFWSLAKKSEMLLLAAKMLPSQVTEATEALSLFRTSHGVLDVEVDSLHAAKGAGLPDDQLVEPLPMGTRGLGCPN